MVTVSDILMGVIVCGFALDWLASSTSHLSDDTANRLSQVMSTAGTHGTSGSVHVKTESWRSKDGVERRTEKTQSWGPGTQAAVLSCDVAYDLGNVLCGVNWEICRIAHRGDTSLFARELIRIFDWAGGKRAPLNILIGPFCFVLQGKWEEAPDQSKFPVVWCLKNRSYLQSNSCNKFFCPS